VATNRFAGAVSAGDAVVGGDGGEGRGDGGAVQLMVTSSVVTNKGSQTIGQDTERFWLRSHSTFIGTTVCLPVNLDSLSMYWHANRVRCNPLWAKQKTTASSKRGKSKHEGRAFHCLWLIMSLAVCVVSACQKPASKDLPRVWESLRQWPITSSHGFRLSEAHAPSTGTIARPNLTQTATLTAVMAEAANLEPPQRTHALVWYYLSTGEISLARRQLTSLSSPTTAAWLNDRAITQAEWALRHGRPEDFETALKTFNNLTGDAGYAETAHFNRALLLQHLGLALRAEAEWKHYLAIDPNSAWAAVAKRHLANLIQQPPDISHLREALTRFANASETAEAQSFFDQHLGALLDDVGTLAEAYLTSGALRHLQSLQYLARQTKQRANDMWVADLVHAIAKLQNPEHVGQWLAARHVLCRARQLYPIEGKPTEAEVLYEQARQSFLAISDTAGAAEAELGLVYCAVQRPETVQLDRLSTELLSTARTRRYARLEGQVLRVRAQLALRQARPALAVSHCQAALVIFQRLSDWEEIQRTLLILSDAYEQQGNASAALLALRQLLQTGQQRGINPRRRSQACAFAARTCAAAGAFELGLVFAEEARAAAAGQTFPAFQLDAETLLAVLNIKSGRPTEAAAALERATQVLESVSDPRVRAVLSLDFLPTAAWCRMALGQPAAALQLCADASQNLQTGRHDAYWPLIESVQSAAYLALGKAHAAETALETGIRWLETTRLNLSQTLDRQRFFHRHAELYERLAALRLKRGRIREAFACVELARARTLLDRCQTAEEKPIRLVAFGASFIETLQKQLPEQVIVLAYAVGRESLESFILTRHHLHHRTLSTSPEQLAHDIHALNRYLTEVTSDISCIRQIGQQLYAALIDPLNITWKDDTRLVIIPDGPLYSLPWAVLCDANGEWFARQVAFSICPSVATLVQAIERHHQPLQPFQTKTVLIAADPDLVATAEAYDLPPLSGARDEVLCLQSILGSTITLTGSELTKVRLFAALQSAWAAHLAVHGTAEQEAPLQSALYLTATSEDDGRLTAAEIYERFFPQLRLVVLSACESGRGASLRGEGVTGLGQAFLAAGASSVIATLTRTDDHFLRNLMCRFHAMWQMEASPSVALQRTWQAFLEHHPAQWANVVLLGAP